MIEKQTQPWSGSGFSQLSLTLLGYWQLPGLAETLQNSSAEPQAAFLQTSLHTTHCNHHYFKPPSHPARRLPPLSPTTHTYLHRIAGPLPTQLPITAPTSVVRSNTLTAPIARPLDRLPLRLSRYVRRPTRPEHLEPSGENNTAIRAQAVSNHPFASIHRDRASLQALVKSIIPRQSITRRAQNKGPNRAKSRIYACL